MPHLLSRVGTLALMVISLTPAAWADAQGVHIEPQEKWTNVFADREVEFHFAVEAAGAFRGRAAWAVTLGRRTVPGSPGEKSIAAAPGTPARLTVRLRTPQLKPGVILRALLTVSVYREGQDKPDAVHERTLWLFPADPFADRRQWLKDLKLTLFDPAQTTVAAFKKIDLPFETIDNPATIGDLKEGLLVIGEATSFRDYPEVPERMVQAAARGLPVLCLAPTDGILAVPGADEAHLPAPASLSWRRQDVIADLDKRLDALGWPPDSRMGGGILVLKAYENRVVAEVAKEGTGWHWFEIRFGNQGRLVVCGFALTGKPWDAGPTPRFLLARLLEHVTSKDSAVSADAMK